MYGFVFCVQTNMVSCQILWPHGSLLPTINYGIINDVDRLLVSRVYHIYMYYVSTDFTSILDRLHSPLRN